MNQNAFSNIYSSLSKSTNCSFVSVTFGLIYPSLVHAIFNNKGHADAQSDIVTKFAAKSLRDFLYLRKCESV